jgi:flagellar biosynthesis/type III secretory pathway protein FliH
MDNVKEVARYRPTEDPTADKKHKFEVLLGDLVIGRAALECDAQLYVNAINDRLKAAYDAGYSAGDADGNDSGYSDGYDEGYNIGHSDGYDVGYRDAENREEDGE